MIDPLFLCPFSMAMFVYQRVPPCSHVHVPFPLHSSPQKTVRLNRSPPNHSMMKQTHSPVVNFRLLITLILPYGKHTWLLKMNIETVDLHIDSMVIFHTYVNVEQAGKASIFLWLSYDFAIFLWGFPCLSFQAGATPLSPEKIVDGFHHGLFWPPNI